MFFILPLCLGLFASGMAKRKLSKYGKVAISNGNSGAESASEMLAYHNVQGVKFLRGGNDQDFFDPRSNSITLSPQSFSSRSVTATAVACHEAGHACQYAQDYFPIKFRNSLVPVVNFASNAWLIILLLGVFLNVAGLVYVAIIVFALVLLFQLATLPVEFNASSRAIAYMKNLNLTDEEMKGAKSVLRSCAFTYVVSALMALLQLI